MKVIIDYNSGPPAFDGEVGRSVPQLFRKGWLSNKSDCGHVKGTRSLGAWRK